MKTTQSDLNCFFLIPLHLSLKKTKKKKDFIKADTSLRKMIN